MRIVNKLLILTLWVSMWPGLQLAGQQAHYDFDSLLKHNPPLETMVSLVFDTFRIFGPEEPLEFTVSTDIRALTKNKFKEEYQEAHVIYQLWDTISISREIQIKPRGVLRLKICNNPPLRVNVRNTNKVFQLLDDLDKLKMVVPCKGTSAYQDYIFSEYLAYKLYNIITDNSFKVRLIKVNYYDTGGKVKAGNAYTFIIESHETLANRLESIPINIDRIGDKDIDPEQAAILYLFQYMVGNTDWTIHGLHNIKLLKTMDVSRPSPLPVAYDFDFAGLVNAHYAAPGEQLDIKTVTERAYMGYCLPDEIMNRTFDLFIQKESQVMNTVHHFDLMSDDLKQRSLNYLREFYDIIKDPERREHRILTKCRN